MPTIDLITRYFPHLTPEQVEHFTQLDALYRDWNAKINVISRKDIDALYEHHVLHSLGIAQMIRFKPGTHILDFGTGGGFPGIPLAILFPECEFLLVDSIGKKVKVAAAVAEALGLKNVRTLHGRGEDVKEQFDFVVSRAVMRLASSSITSSATGCPMGLSASRAESCRRRYVPTSASSRCKTSTLPSTKSTSRRRRSFTFPSKQGFPTQGQRAPTTRVVVGARCR